MTIAVEEYCCFAMLSKAMVVCQNSGYTIENEFSKVRKIVKTDATTKQYLTMDLPENTNILIIFLWKKPFCPDPY
jgi:hypothetical protein